MRLKDPYFENITELGDLSISFILFETKYSVLFTLTDTASNLYLCVCCDVRYTQRWIIAPVDKSILRDLLTNKITIRDAFIGYYTDKHRYLVKYKTIASHNTERVGELTSKAVSIDEIPEEDLPTVGETMEAEDDEYADVLAQF